MTSQPFTPAGVQAKMDELYALSDADLFIQADLVLSDLRNWVSQNFTLTTAQETYFNTVDESWIRFVSYQASLAMEYRLNITLDPPDPTPPAGASKLLGSSSDIWGTIDDSGDFVTGGKGLRLFSQYV